jgi:Flp pilus assembly protein TadG
MQVMRLLRSPHLRRRAERGGAAMIVAVLLGGGVLIGVSALAIDVGNMMFERRQLQNGADAGARALAKICSEDLTQCDVSNTTTMAQVRSINSSNASDGTAALDNGVPGVSTGVCGRVPGAANLPACPASALNNTATEWTQCAALPDDWASGTAPYVQVYTITATATSTGVLDSFLGSVDSSPTACARYGFGLPKGATTFPLTISECEFDEAVDLNGVPGAGYGVETAIALKYKINPTSTACDPDAIPSGGDYYGGFGWLANLDCLVSSKVPGWSDGNTGVGGQNDCVQDLEERVYLLPIYTCISDSNSATLPPKGTDSCVPGSPGGTNTWYWLRGYEAFQLTGWWLTSTGGWEGNPSADAKQQCNEESKDNKCITGFFIKDYDAGDGEVEGGTPVGTEGPFVYELIG